MLFGATGAQAQLVATDVPQNVEARATDYDSILVTWDEPDNNEDVVTAYEVGWVAHDAQANFEILDPEDYGDSMTVSVNSPERARITSLMAGTRYVVGVRAVNTTPAPDEMSDWAFGSDQPETDPLPDIDMVEDLELDPGDGMLTATWEEVDDPIGIHHYKVMTTGPDGYSLTQGTGSDVTEFTIMNLTNGVEYTVRVQAIGSNPDGTADADDDGRPDREGALSDPVKETPMAPMAVEPEQIDSPAVVVGRGGHHHRVLVDRGRRGRTVSGELADGGRHTAGGDGRRGHNEPHGHGSDAGDRVHHLGLRGAVQRG